MSPLPASLGAGSRPPSVPSTSNPMGSIVQRMIVT